MDSKTTTLKDNVARLVKSRNDIDREIQRARALLLKALPESVGFESVDELIAALVPLASAQTQARWGAPKAAAAAANKGKRFDGEVRARVRHALESEGQSPAAVARATGISLATLAKWRKDWGLGPLRKRKSNGVGHGGNEGSPAHS